MFVIEDKLVKGRTAGLERPIELEVLAYVENGLMMEFLHHHYHKLVIELLLISLRFLLVIEID